MAKSAVTKSRLAKSMNDTIKKLKVSDDMVVDQSGIGLYMLIIRSL